MRTIWKYTLTTDALQTLDIPGQPEFLDVSVQRGEPVLWVDVDTDETTQRYVIRTYGTGHPHNENEIKTYLGSYRLHDGAFVGHVYAVRAYKQGDQS